MNDNALVQVCVAASRYFFSHVQTKSAMESEDKSTDLRMRSLRLHHAFCSYAYGKSSRQCMRTESIKYRHINMSSVSFILLLDLLTSLHE